MAARSEYIIDLDVQDRFQLSYGFKRELKQRKEQFGFGLLGAVVYYRTYSRTQWDGSQEQWADTVIRVVEGMLTVRKWWYLRNRLRWDNDYWSGIAEEMADAIFTFKFLPAGRHLWANGTEHAYKLGGMSSNNCGFRTITHLSRDAEWVADALMLGVGVGFDTDQNSQDFKRPAESEVTYKVPDTREGWAESLRVLIESYEHGSQTVRFDYSQVRPAGAPIKGFGGVASGPEPLQEGHERIRSFLDDHIEGKTTKVRLVTDVMNSIGYFVVSGNVRRSAQIALGKAGNDEFLNLKNYEMNPERGAIGWLSNNSIKLEDHEDFKHLGDLAERVCDNGEPGIANMLNITKYGRYGEKNFDPAIGMNPK